jgi:hypothetical protein
MTPLPLRTLTRYSANGSGLGAGGSLLTERLDQHRGRGQQQITVKHVTVNADQAVVADQVVSGSGKDAPARSLLMNRTNEAMEVIEPRSTIAMQVPGGRVRGEMSDNLMHKAHAAPRCTATSKRSGKPCCAPAVKGWKVCRLDRESEVGRSVAREGRADKIEPRDRSCPRVPFCLSSLF